MDSNDPTIAQFGSKISDLNRQIEKVNSDMAEYEKKVKGTPEEKQVKDLQNSPPLVNWGDQRLNPMFLKIAEYFGIDQREYPRAESKITSILEWAMEAANSKNTGDIMKKVIDTYKGLHSVGFTEKPYALLYRYIKLARQEADIKKEMSSYKK